MGYLRALMNKKEHSERALELTDEVLSWNAGHYSVWHFRRDILNGMDANWSDELMYLREMAEENPKNYQIWHHRQVIVDELKDASQEISFINTMLQSDSKNYHAWSYRYTHCKLTDWFRQWVVKTFGLWANELQDMERLISEDIRNNSAWNHRFFVLSQGPLQANIEACEEEAIYASEKIKLAPSNPSPWNYLNGLVQLAKVPLKAHSKVLDWAVKSNSQSVALLAHVAKYQPTKERYSELAELDPIRKEWWISLANSKQHV